MDSIARLHESDHVDLAVFDPLAPFCPNENSPALMLDFMTSLTSLTRRGLAVLLLHHPGKGGLPLGRAARGFGSLLAQIDISIEMRHPGGDFFSRRRRFVAASRHRETPPDLFLELNPEATDYLAVPQTPARDIPSSWQALQRILQTADQHLTRRQIETAWPADVVKPPKSTLCRWLAHAVQGNLLAVEGTGRKNDAPRYGLPNKSQDAVQAG